MESPIFASPSSKYPGCNITLGSSHPITTSIPPPLKPLFTYEERIASLKTWWRTCEGAGHSKKVMAAAGFSGARDTDPNYMQCFTCSLILYSGYCTPEPFEEHLQKAPHCSLVLQIQKEAELKAATKKTAEEKVVEKSKIEPPSASPVKPLGTYEERLATLTNWFWSASLSKETVAAAGFRGIDGGYRARCMHCSLTIAGNRNFEPFKKHLQESPECPLVLQLETTGLGTPEGIKRAELEALEAAKPTPVAADIGFFDATLLCDIQEFCLFCEAAGFLQRFRQCQHQYRESDLLALLPELLRGPALAWYRQQSEKGQSESETAKKSLSEWLEALVTAFPAKPLPESSIQTSTSAPRPPPQYHSCLNCSASFSSLTRLLQHNQSICKKAVCKHCEEAFDSKNKLHEHLRQHHTTKEVVKTASGRSFNREGDRISPTTSTTTSPTPTTTPPKTTTKISISRPVTPPEQARNPPTPPATPATIAPTTPKRSRLPTLTPKPAPKRAETASVDCPLTSPATPRPKPRKSTSKPYFTIHDLVRMFREKPRPFGLPQHQNRHPSPQSIGARQSRSPPTYQSRITAYFLPAANQKAPLSQGLKSPKSKTFQQYMPAERIRPVLPEKSTSSPYKKPGFSYTSLQPRSSSRSSFWPSLTSPPLPRSPHRDLHVYCTCFGYSSFRNGLFDHPRPSQRHPSNRRPLGGRRG